jgi:hypothetical protein
MSMKSITILGFTAALIAFGAAPAKAHVDATTNVVEASEAGTLQLDGRRGSYGRVSFRSFSTVRSGSFRSFSTARSFSFHRGHRASVRHHSFHRHNFARNHVRFGGGHRATPARLTYTPRLRNVARPPVRTTINGPRPNWRNHPLLNVRSG